MHAEALPAQALRRPGAPRPPVVGRLPAWLHEPALHMPTPGHNPPPPPPPPPLTPEPDAPEVIDPPLPGEQTPVGEPETPPPVPMQHAARQAEEVPA